MHCHRIVWALLSLLFCIGGCQSQPVRVRTPTQRPAPLVQDPFIEVYFNQRAGTDYTEPYRQKKRPGDDLEERIVAAIASAHHSVDVAVHEFRLPRIAQALVERQRAGVKVRVIIENTYSRPWSSVTATELSKLNRREQGRYREFVALVDRDQNGQVSPTEARQGDALILLHQAGIPLIDDTADGSAGSQLMHHKFVVIDRQQVVVTSANFTTSDVHGDFQSPASRGNNNNLLLIQSRELAQVFEEEFSFMWGDGPGGKLDSKFGTHKPWRAPRYIRLGSSMIAVQFSPAAPPIPWSRSPNGLIGQTLQTATQKIDLALFVFSDQRLVNRLEERHAAGVKIRALIDPGFAYRPYSEALDMLGITLSDRSQRNCRLETGNHPWPNPISTVGVPRLPRGDLLHHKFGLVDQDTVITGSQNWTEAANNGNDETVLVIHSPLVAAHFQQEFDRLYANATIGIPPKLKRKIETQSSQCMVLPLGRD